MRIALVLGATGGVGGAIAEALLRRGWCVRALVRNPAVAADRSRGGRIAWVEGDALSRADVVGAAAGAEVIVHAVNPPGYRDWGKLVLPMIDNSIAAARAAGGARIVLPGTTYNFDPARHSVIDENTPQLAQSRKGKIRRTLEATLEMALPRVPSLIVRAGDFFGPGARASWFAQALVKPNRPVTRLLNPGKGVGHSWAYLPDLADTIAQLLDVPERLSPFERVQFEGLWDPDGSVLPAAIERVVGCGVPERSFPWWLMRALSPFGGFPREVVEIEPYWRNPVRLDNRRLVALLGAEPRTPLDQAVRATLGAMGALELPERKPGLPSLLPA
jgi:nucleoside-diphosphate-sugar epimerase